MPVVDLETPTLCLVGAPNVGKSSLVCLLSTGKPEVTDTPGLLRRRDGNLHSGTESYRKVMCMMYYADHHVFPIVTFIDTHGAYADLKYEEFGQVLYSIPSSEVLVVELCVTSVKAFHKLCKKLKNLLGGFMMNHIQYYWRIRNGSLPGDFFWVAMEDGLHGRSVKEICIVAMEDGLHDIYV